MRLTVAVLALAIMFLAACFYWPSPAPRRYTLFPDQPQWYKLDTRGIDK